MGALTLVALIFLTLPGVFANPSFTHSELVLTSPAAVKTNAATTMAYTFQLNETLQVNDIVEVVLPGFTLSFAGSIAASAGCASTTFSLSLINSGTSTATMRFSAGSNNLNTGNRYV